jgi:GMP synthase-like glutamine amidotransferase
MRVLSIVHEREAGSGVFADAAGERRDELIEWIPAEAPAPAAESFGAVLVFGGAMHVHQDHDHRWLRDEKELLRALLKRRSPALGVCLGAQLLAEVAGGEVRPAAKPEIGWTPVRLTAPASDDPMLGPLPDCFNTFQWHSYEICVPRIALELARSGTCLQAFRLSSAPWWGIQFHAEVTDHTIVAWIDDYRSDPDAVRADLDWTAMLARTREEIARWNELGRGICRRFLDYAERLSEDGREEGGS